MGMRWIFLEIHFQELCFRLREFDFLRFSRSRSCWSSRWRPRRTATKVVFNWNSSLKSSYVLILQRIHEAVAEVPSHWLLASGEGDRHGYHVAYFGALEGVIGVDDSFLQIPRLGTYFLFSIYESQWLDSLNFWQLRTMPAVQKWECFHQSQVVVLVSWQLRHIFCCLVWADRSRNMISKITVSVVVITFDSVNSCCCQKLFRYSM